MKTTQNMYSLYNEDYEINLISGQLIKYLRPRIALDLQKEERIINTPVSLIKSKNIAITNLVMCIKSTDMDVIVNYFKFSVIREENSPARLSYRLNHTALSKPFDRITHDKMYYTDTIKILRSKLLPGLKEHLGYNIDIDFYDNPRKKGLIRYFK